MNFFHFFVFTWPIWMGIVAKVVFKVMFKVEVGLCFRVKVGVLLVSRV